jgi:hypothetical protein
VPLATKDDMAYFTSNPGANVYLNSLVKKAGYDPNSQEGQLLKRAYLYKHLQDNNQGYINKTKDEVDDSQLQSENFRREMKSLAETMKSGNSGNKDVTINDVYSDIASKGANKKYGIPLNELSPTTQAVLIKHAQTTLGNSQATGDVQDLNNIWVRKNTDGTYSLMKSNKENVMDYNDKQIAPLDFTSVNTMKGVNGTLKERQKVLQHGNQTTKRPPLSAFLKK